MAALMASTYKAYLGVGLGPLEVRNFVISNEMTIDKVNLIPIHDCFPPLQFLTKFRIPHPGRVGGRVFIDKLMPLMLSWVLGGNR